MIVTHPWDTVVTEENLKMISLWVHIKGIALQCPQHFDDEDEDNGPDYDGDHPTDCDMNAKTLRHLKARLAKGKFLMGGCTKFIRKLR